jgi:WD40 repeat protein/tRNA A-37 threonylcarbamoyl transferase component Bud32
MGAKNKTPKKAIKGAKIMTTDNFKRAGEIFQNAIEIEDPTEREQYLKNACKSDPKLRAEVETLLKAHEKAGNYLEAPAVGVNVTLDSPAQIEGPGTKIGRYELLSLIGEGGMGLVYLAEQKEPVKRRIALKIIKPGMDSRQVIARFEAERQALALLDHPNIAHVFDAGTTEAGRPYFVMEYVKGMCITAYCDQRKLNIEQRLRLFEQVCEAIHHAHQKGIIHRDIKPSNILVSVHGDRAVPKIIDFGIAKAITQPLTEKTFVTFQGQLLGTPEYMSPEQVDLAIQDIDIRSDIYSLGVVLYELLAGVLPFERESLAHLGFTEVQRTIREQEPASPSIRLTNLGEQAKIIAVSRGTQLIALARRLHRELEWIPLKAMRKDRCRRYRSASEMADDIRNYLTGLPLIAGPETAAYRIKKFVHKHAGSVATVILIAAVIILGLIVSTAMYFRAEQARKSESIARTHAEQAEKVAQQQREIAEERAEEYRHSLYVHRINLADVAHREGNIGRLRKLLDACPEDLRAWEWYHLNHVSDQAAMTLLGDKDGVFDVALSPDGKRIVSAGGSGTIKIWDAGDGRELMALRRNDATVMSVRFSPDGKRIASISRDMKIKVWDAQSGTEVKTLTRDVSVSRDFIPTALPVPIVFSPDSKKIASISLNDTIKVWEADSGTALMAFKGHEKFITGLVFTPDGKRIISSSKDQTLRVWDESTGQQLMVLKGHEGIICNVAISPDGKRIVSVSLDRTAKVWDVTTGAELLTLYGIGNFVRSVAFSNDGARFITGDGEGKIKVWDAANGTELKILLGHLESIRDVAFSPNGKRIISSSSDGTIKIWKSGVDYTAPTTLDQRYRSIAFSPEGKYIVASGGKDRSIRILDAVTRYELMRIDGPGGGASFSPDTNRIISTDGNDIDIWDVSSGKKLMTLLGHENTIWSASYSPDGTRIVSGGEDKTVRVWNAITGTEIMTLRGHSDYPDYPELSPVSSVAFSPDGQLIASGSYDYTVKIWNARTGAEVKTIQHSDLVSGVAFSPDGKRLASACSDNTIRIWDVATGDELQVLSGHEGEALSVAFSPDGRRIASGSKDDTVRIWDAETGIEVLRLPIHGWVWGVCFSPNGKILATASDTSFGYSNYIITLWESD